MSWLDRILGREARTIRPPSSWNDAQTLRLFGIDTSLGPTVSVDSALKVPAFAQGVGFLSRTLASLPLTAHRTADASSERIRGGLDTIVNEAFNPEWSSFEARRYFWTQVFLYGRGLLWIERRGTSIAGLWPLDASTTTVAFEAGRKVYRYNNQVYSASEVIDVPFLLKSDQVTAVSAVAAGEKAIRLALAMNDYASGFFAGGGVPPLALVGKMPSGAEAIARAQKDIKNAIDAAKSKDSPVFPIPPDYDLKPVGFDPEKGQMTEARRFQVEEIARVLGLPPVFLQELSHGTYTNTEQQDLHLTKHVVVQWGSALEQEMNLKLFGQMNNRRYVKHDLNGLMRGDFPTRMQGLTQAIQSAILTPNEARALENRPAMDNGDTLLIQGATVPLGTQPNDPNVTPPNGAADDVAA